MAKGPTSRAIHHLHSTILAGANGLADSQLLEAFIQGRDDAAFEAIVRRHGPLVLGVCRRVLGDGHDAEDAFQATFLVLVRKAATIVPREMVANWLYGVAFRTASKARAMNVKRRAKEAQVRERPVPDAHEELFWRDLKPVLDRELQTLPDKYRAPIVLCDLEGRARKEAAEHLGWPEGTLSSRLAAGRRLLARRLNRCGLSSSGVLLPMLVPQLATSPIPSTLFDSTIRAAALVAAGKTFAAASVSTTVAALTDGVLKSMLLTKLKVATAVVVACTLAGASLGMNQGRDLGTSHGTSQTTLQAQADPAAQRIARGGGPGPLPNPPSTEQANLATTPAPANLQVSHIWVVHWDRRTMDTESSDPPVRVAVRSMPVQVTTLSATQLAELTQGWRPRAGHTVGGQATPAKIKSLASRYLQDLQKHLTPPEGVPDGWQVVVVHVHRERGADDDAPAAGDRVIRIDIRPGTAKPVVVRPARPVG